MIRNETTLIPSSSGSAWTSRRLAYRPTSRFSSPSPPLMIGAVDRRWQGPRAGPSDRDLLGGIRTGPGTSPRAHGRCDSGRVAHRPPRDDRLGPRLGGGVQTEPAALPAASLRRVIR